MNIYQQYAAVNGRLAQGKRVFFHEIGGNGSLPRSQAAGHRQLCYPQIGIYTGAGTSHSWLWFVEIFERLGFHDLCFLDEKHIREGRMGGVDVLAVSGGDTFAMAEGLGLDGAQALEMFIVNGGLYLGSCAGAYLPLKSSKAHLNLFNFVEAKVANLTRILPEAKTVSKNFCTPYGCSYIFHPVREALSLASTGVMPFDRVDNFVAPLYGGPAMIASDKMDVMAYYSGFTQKTTFLVDEWLAGETLLGKAAVVRKRMGKGNLYLFGPHFEHPFYPIANALIADTIYWDAGQKASNGNNKGHHLGMLHGDTCKSFIRNVKRELSNARIVAFAMEGQSMSWLIGKKEYEPEKIRVFLEALWKRLKPLEKRDTLRMEDEEKDNIFTYASQTTSLLREMKKESDKGHDTNHLARAMFENLKMLSALFLGIYFKTIHLESGVSHAL